MIRERLLATLAMVSVAALPTQGKAQPGDRTASLAGWWSAASVEARLVLADSIARSGVDFETVHRFLKTGRPYGPPAAVGRLERSRRNADGLPHDYQLAVPDDYDPLRRYPVRVYLHGGVARQQPGRWRDPDRVVRDDAISVFPSSWAESLWWEWSQVENLDGILADLKAEYNVDENRVYMFGVSDGGTGAYYHALKAPTRWAAYVILIGHPAVLANPRFRSGGEVFVRNLSHQPLFVANAVNDRLYPAKSMRPYVELFREVGSDVVFREKDGDHGVSWWPEEAPGIERFLAEHPRNPTPPRLDWETDDLERGGRAHWIRIDRLGSEPTRRDPLGSDPFPHWQPAGRVVAEREGNVVRLTTYNVSRLTVLVAPDVFDLGSPVQVEVNDRTVFSSLIRPNVRTLLRWAAQDDDRTMLYAAALAVSVASKGAASVRVVP